ncbi:MAG: TetR/AcrR family transcriptional regulator [Pseudoflavonifractor sp.]|nr:TetR/AcrR family transcriptional regulator [Pseudoflavonifractor sp.]
MVLKTREKLIEVARQLFTYKGIENTTMNDIAAASEKGRRTIYTYFKNKREIYNAVIERESEHLVVNLRKVMEMPVSPTEKLERFISVRFDIIESSTYRHNPIRAFFTRDMRRVEHVRRLAVSKELEMLDELIAQGVAAGEFGRESAAQLKPLMVMIFQGVDFSFLRDNFEELHIDRSILRGQIIKFILHGIKP